MSFAEENQLSFNNRHSFRVAPSYSDDSFYVTRLNANIDYTLPGFKKRIVLQPFSEFQYNLDQNAWWRKEAGVELGISFWQQAFYYGASFQHIWQQPGNYAVESIEETSEWESRFVICPPLKWWIFKDKAKFYLIDEYTYDFTRGQPTFNEVALILEWQINQNISLPVGWRHVDRIHDFDADLFEFSVLFSF